MPAEPSRRQSLHGHRAFTATEPSRPQSLHGHRAFTATEPSRARRVLVDQVDQPGQDVGVGVGEDAVAQIEDVARRRPGGGQTARAASATTGHGARQMAGSRLPWTARSGRPAPGPRRGARASRCPPRRLPPIAMSASSSPVADPEVDPRNSSSARPARTLVRAAARSAGSRAGEQRAGPAVEQLDRGHAGGHLGLEEARARSASWSSRAPHSAGRGMHHRLGPGVIPGWSALDEVAGDGERCPGKSDQGNIEFLHQYPDGLLHPRCVAALVRGAATA